MSRLLESGFGGVLADDMGLGKTIQVRALLQARLNPNYSVRPDRPRGSPVEEHPRDERRKLSPGAKSGAQT